MMKIRLLVSTLVLAFVSMAMLAQTTESTYNYATYRNFQLATPGADDFGMIGFNNPANLGLLSQPAARFYLSEKDDLDQYTWGYAGNFGPLGFGLMHNQLVDDQYVRDYRVNLGFGDQDFTMGFGYSWFSSNIDQFKNLSYYQAGLMMRPAKSLSFGGFASFNPDDENDGFWQAEVGFRPLETRLVTLFAEAYSTFEDKSFDDDNWSIGGKFEVFDGIRLAGKYNGNESYQAGLEISLGFGAVSAVQTIDADGNSDRKLYSARIGYLEPNLFTPMFLSKKSALKIPLKGRVKYQKFVLFDDQSHSLLHLLNDLGLAAKDYNINTIAINLSGAYINKENAWEISEKIKEVKAHGKRVIVYLDRADMEQFQIAAAADLVVMDPMGAMVLPGYAMGRTFIKDLLDKVGIGVDELRFFKYKSAAESLSRTKMSEADSVQRQELVNDQYELLKQDVTSGRNITPEEFDRIVDEELVIMADRAKELGLVDKLDRWVNIDEIIKSENGAPLMSINRSMMLTKMYEELNWGKKPEIAVVYALGVCDMDAGINARRLERIFQGLTNNSNVKAVVFRVDSPGGDAMASDVVAEAIKKCSDKKPVIISQGSVAASGGYWISMYGDKIIAAPNTITGSIGVIGTWLYDKGMSEHLGLDFDYVKKGKYADLPLGPTLPLIGLGIPSRKMTPDERGKIEKMIRQGYAQFVDKVASGRDTTAEEIEKIAQGRVWSGVDGLENGLVDEIGGFQVAFRAAREMAGLDKDEKVVFNEYPSPGLFDPGIFIPKLVGIEENSIEKDYQRTLEYIRMLAKQKGQPVYMIAPDYLEAEKN
jgi:protease-4